MATIDYAKYENTQKNVLTNLYNNVEKKQKKLLEQTKENAELLEYLSDKIANAFKPQSQNFYTIDNSLAFKKSLEWAKKNPQEAQEIREKILKEFK